MLVQNKKDSNYYAMKILDKQKVCAFVHSICAMAAWMSRDISNYQVYNRHIVDNCLDIVYFDKVYNVL